MTCVKNAHTQLVLKKKVKGSFCFYVIRWVDFDL
jgi:hypothetical protein